MSEGSIYILQNPVMDEDMLKIGRTERKVSQRAKELFTSGLPEAFNIRYEKDVPDCVLAEKLVHEKLKKYRYRSNREFFRLPLERAIPIVEELIHNEFDKDAPPIQLDTHRLDKGSTFRWTCHSKGIVLLFRYENWLAEKPSIENFWGCKTKDHILLTNRHEDNPLRLVELAKKAHIGGTLSEIISIYPGDRIVMIGSPRQKHESQQLSIFEPELSIVSVIDCWEYATMIGLMENVDIHPDGFPIAFGDCFDDQPPEIVHEAFRRVVKMGSPDVFPNPDYVIQHIR